MTTEVAQPSLASQILEALGTPDTIEVQLRITVSYGAYCASLLIEPLNDEGERSLMAIAKELGSISENDDRIDFCSSRMIRFNVVGSSAHEKVGRVHRVLKRDLQLKNIMFEDRHDLLR